MLKLLALSFKTWNVAKPGAWLPRPPPGDQQSQDSSPILFVELHRTYLWRLTEDNYSVISRSSEDSIDRPLSELLLDYPL